MGRRSHPSCGFDQAGHIPESPPRMSLWLDRMQSVIGGCLEMMTGQRLLSALLIGLSLFAVIQLLAILFTRWGQRHSTIKALVVSILAHCCAALAIPVIEMPGQAPQSLETATSISVRQLRIDPIDRPLTIDANEMPIWKRPFSPMPTEFNRIANSRDEFAPAPARPGRPLDSRLTPAPAPSEPPVFESPQAVGPHTLSRPDAPSTPAIPFEELSIEAPAAFKPLPTARRKVAPVDLADTTPSRPYRSPIQSDMGRVSPLSPLGSNLEPSPQALGDISKRESSADRLRSEGTSQRVGSRARSNAGPLQFEINRLAPGVVRGFVTDRNTDQPLASAVIRFDQSGDPLTAMSDEQGAYELRLSEVPENFALSGTHPRYSPQSRSVRGAQVRGRTLRLDFALSPTNHETVAIEREPKVHHLGNDRFEGLANSQFQIKSEGKVYSTQFRLTEKQIRSASRQVELCMMARGVQCPAPVVLNGTLLDDGVALSPEDGSYRTVRIPFDCKLLKAGVNQIRMEAVSCHGDLDDFEFVNLQIRLSPVN